MRKSPETDAFWQAYRAQFPDAPADYDLMWFGGADIAMANQLADLVVSGPKRATTSLPRDFETGVGFPKPGDQWLLVDGLGRPRSVLRTTRVDTARFGDVDAAFAWDEGEGDRSLAWWRRAHQDYFGRQALAEGFVFDDDSPVVLERFACVWPNADP